jgi:hypothetical protein
VEKGKDEDIPESQSKKEKRPSRGCKRVVKEATKLAQRKAKPPRKKKPVGEFSQEEMEKVPSEYEMLRLVNVIKKQRQIINRGLDLNGLVQADVSKMERQKVIWEANIEKKKKNDEITTEHSHTETVAFGEANPNNETFLDTFDIDCHDDIHDDVFDAEFPTVDAGKLANDQG